MKRPTDSPEVERLIAVCLELYEGEGPEAVEAMLRQHPDSSHVVRERLDMLGRMGLIGEPPRESMPERIGGYRILRTLGRGGMGIVYEAEQEQPRRKVALKVLRTALGEGVRGRFEHEAELLARLNHPGIAQVYEAGTATVGGMTMPFFAMELVRGMPIDAYAATAGLGVRARLQLVADVGDAIHHAHQKGVVHRDLKPANILVDERGRPRVLDFGIARRLDPDIELETLRTEAGQLLGTLAYMSPEQAAGNPDDVDSRTDVYSLGVVAWELLAGRLPVELDGLPVLAALEAIRDQDPPLLGSVNPKLRGDVETIVAKALEKEKERRYSSMHELAADVTHFLRDEPISARPATATYQLKKFARRHRALVGGSAAFVVAITLGFAGTLYGMLRAAEQRDDAERRFEQATTVLDFKKRMLSLADPSHQGIKVEDMLDGGASLLEPGDYGPVEEASIRLMLGEEYEALGAYEKADPLIAEAVRLFEEALGEEDLQTLSAKVRLASLYGPPLGRYEDARRVLDGVAGTASRVHGPSHDVTLAAQLTGAVIANQTGDQEEAVRLSREVIAHAGPERPQWVAAKRRLAKALDKLGRTDEALAIAHEVCAWSLDTYGKEHEQTWLSMSTLGTMLQERGRLVESGEILEELLALRMEHMGETHPKTLNTMTQAATSYIYRGRFAEAEELLRRTIAILEREYSPDHPERLFALNALGSCLSPQRREAEAEAVFREVVERTSDLLGPYHLDTLSAMGNLAQSLARQGKDEEAEELLRIVVDGSRDTLGPEHPDTLISEGIYGIFLSERGRLDEAEEYLMHAIESGRDVLGPNNAKMGNLLAVAGRNCLRQERFEDAEALLLEGREWFDRTRPFPNDPEVRELLQMLEALYRRWGRVEDAERTARLIAGDS